MLCVTNDPVETVFPTPTEQEDKNRAEQLAASKANMGALS